MLPGMSGLTGPLRGLRILELATGIAGPYAGRLLGMLGATVVKAEPPGGDPTRELPVDDQPVLRPGPVFVHLNAGKRLVDRERIALAAALDWADVVLADSAPVGDRVPEPPRGPLVVTTPSGTPDDEELLVQAASGLLAASVDSEGRPLRFPGWQSQYLAGAYAAALALVGLSRYGRRAEVTWSAALLSGFEAHAAGELYSASSGRPDEPAERERNAGHLARTYPSGVFRCADGAVIPGTVRAEDWLRQCEVYGRPDLVYDERFVWANRWANRELLRKELQPWYLARGKRQIFQAALDAGWAAAMVLTARDALTDPHLRARGFLSPVTGATRATVAGRPWRSRYLPEGAPLRLSRPDGDRRWYDPARPRRGPTPRPPDLSRLRVLELTLAWAGPLLGRHLGALGADVVRIEVGNRPDGWRTRVRWRDLGDPPAGVDPEHYTWDAAAQFNSLNRDKRAVSVDIATRDGAEVFRSLVSAADVLVVNMSPDVLDKRGVADHVRGRVAHGLVVITMPALGATGPYRDMAGYGMLTEGMGGFAARFGAVDEPAGASATYYPDAVAGVHGVVAVLAALAARTRSGAGDWVDLSQQETMWLQLGEALVLASREGREPDRLGNAEPGAAASGILRTADGWVGYVDRRPGGRPPSPAWARRSPSGKVVAALRGDGVAAAPVRDLAVRYRDGELRTAGLVEELPHPAAGNRAYLALPGRLDGQPLASTRPAPMFDQHTDEVLAEWLGLSWPRIAELRTTGAVGTRPKQPRRRATSRSTPSPSAPSPSAPRPGTVH